MKNNIVKRLLAGSLALAVGGAGLTGAYGSERYDLSEVKAADKDTERLEETADEVMSLSTSRQTRREM